MCTQKFWHTKYITLKIKLLPFGVSDCCACFNYFFLKSRVRSFNYLHQLFSILKKYFNINFLCIKSFADFQQFYLLLSPYLCFISFLYVDLYVLGDDALVS